MIQVNLCLKKDFFKGLFNCNDFNIKSYIIDFYNKCGYADVRPLSKILIGKYTKNIDKFILYYLMTR